MVRGIEWKAVVMLHGRGVPLGEIAKALNVSERSISKRIGEKNEESEHRKHRG